MQELREELAGCEVQTCWPSQEAGDLHDSFCLGCTQRVWADGTGNDECCRWNYAESEEAEYDLGTDSNSNKIIISQGSNQKEIYEKVYRRGRRFSWKNQ